MKISFIEPHLKIFGGIRRIIELSNHLVKKGHDITIFHSDGTSCDWMKCEAKIKSYQDILRENHDVVIYNDPNSIDYNLARKSKAKLKIFYVLELYNKELLRKINISIYFPNNKRTLILKKSLISPYLKMSNASWEKEWLKENMNIDSELLIGGINTEMFHPVDVEKKTDKISILFSGDPRERKGTKTIIEALDILKKKNINIKMNSYYGKGIEQKDMARVYSSADIFIDAQKQAGWNNPVAEAMACKVPVVCTDIGGVGDFAFNNKTALLVKIGDPKAMAFSVLRLIRDVELRNKLKENAYQHIIKFRWDESAGNLLKIINRNI